MEALLEELFDIHREYYYSILPTATPYSRNSIFAGLLPADIWRLHPEMWQEQTDEERTKNRYERQLLEQQLKRLDLEQRALRYIKIFDADEAISTRRQVGSFKDLALMSMVFNFLDILEHGRSENDILQELAPDEAAFRSVMKAWFTHSPLFDILRALSTHDSTIVITTDHGAVLANGRAALVYGNRDTSSSLR